MNNIPNTFIINNDIVTVNVMEMTPEDLGDIAEWKAYCNKVERLFGTTDIDQMLFNGIGYKMMHKYINARHNLVQWGYGPEDWKERIS